MILEEVNESFLLHSIDFTPVPHAPFMANQVHREREEPQLLQVIILQFVYENQANMRLLDWSVNMSSNSD